MNLSDLNQISRDEKELLDKANNLYEKEKYLANKRKSMTDIFTYFRSYKKEFNCGFEEQINNDVREIVDSMSCDFFRAVEMKYAAEARELRLKAKAKNQQIKNYFADGEALK